MRRRSIVALAAVLAVAGPVGACSSPTPAPSAAGAGGATATTTTTPGPSPASSTASSTASSAASGPPVGLIAVQEYQPGDTEVFASAVFQNPSVSGVALRVNWSDVEPSAGQFTWHMVDDVFAQATASHKFVVLIIVPGFGTPAWALSGVATATFARQYGLGAGDPGLLPMPWDQVYLSRWFAFLQQVAGRYGDNRAFRMISAAGPTSVSVEMSLPNGEADIVRWMGLGYTSARYVAAWGSALQAYVRLFPKQYVSIALYPGLPIGSNGRRSAVQHTATPESILAEGMQYKDRIAVQTSGLTGSRSGSDLYDMVSANSPSIVTGFQLATSATRSPGQMGDPTSPVHALSLSLQLGVAAHVEFLEVYGPDVVNPSMQSTLQAAQAQLPH